ncbi:MAG: GIY-YIG nuclease family protein [Candidatus Omnitrophota bacterium]|nr:MAG: GIY-YIG nuclease family protein [Candidatus Omnitrophota bacterium]
MGSCKDLAARLKQHNQNCVCSTKHRGPFRIIYREVHASKTKARKREKELKHYKGSAVFKRVITQSPSSSLV